MINLDWKIGYHSDETGTPEKWYDAKIPGAAQLDVVDDGLKKDWQFADNYRKFSWMEDVWWTYKTQFSRPILNDGERLSFCSKGIDYKFIILLNGKILLQQEGMFKHVHLDISPFLETTNELCIKIFPVPKSNTEANDRFQADHSVKPAVSYGWDWHPRLVPSGIWDETWLEIEKPGIVDFTVRYSLSADLKDAYVTCNIPIVESVEKLELRVITAGTQVYHDKFEPGRVSQKINFHLQNIQLWYPIGYGSQPLYTFEVVAYDHKNNMIHRKSVKTGFRKVKLVLNNGTELEKDIFPKSKRLAPITLEVNGIRIFALGTNWVNPEVFPGSITEKRYKELIDAAVEANFNILRTWGGAIVNKDSFFDYCDEKGILVWQEFPLACNHYPDDEDYLDVLRSETQAIVKQLRHHPSISIWCGGNELFNSWSGMTEQSLPLRLINSICLDLSPEIPFMPTSPLDGMGHGHYRFYDVKVDKDVFQIMDEANNTAYTEFGISSPSDAEILREIIPEEELFPPSPDSKAWIAHHGFKTWESDAWLCMEIIEKYFGPQKSLEEIVENGQLLQAIGYQTIFEKARQQWPYCSMALNWCFNEAWPTAANNSIVHYNGKKKQAFEAIRMACRPILASASFSKFLWETGEDFFFQLFLLNNSTLAVKADRMEVYINEELHLSWETGKAKPNTPIAGPIIKWQIPGDFGNRILVKLRMKNNPEWNSDYVLIVKKGKSADPVVVNLLNN